MYYLLRGLQIRIYSLQAEANKIGCLARRDAKVKHSDVAQGYYGGVHSANASMKQAASVASRLSWQTFEAFGTVTNMNFCDVTVRSANLNQTQFKTTEAVEAYEERRELKSFISFGALQAAESFMSATSM